jgi:Spy/CpxP family protein refolding chaperone
MAKKMILGAAAACAALVTLTATAASADPWWAHDGRGDYGRSYERGYSADSLIQREDRLADQIRRLGDNGRFHRWEAGQAWRGLSEARQQTYREMREHGRMLPADDYYRIAQRLDGVDRFIQREGRDWD